MTIVNNFFNITLFEYVNWLYFKIKHFSLYYHELNSKSLCLRLGEYFSANLNCFALIVSANVSENMDKHFIKLL